MKELGVFKKLDPVAGGRAGGRRGVGEGGESGREWQRKKQEELSRARFRGLINRIKI